jgi:dipeptidyl aminopeptidase/acylaminoacyl peptidase
MTAFDRFDPFERRIADAIDEIAAAQLPDYLDDVFQATARTSQRPRWTFPERWLPVDTTLARVPFGRRLPVRQLLIVFVLIALAVASLAVFAGSQRRLPPPFGPAANGQLVYGAHGDLYVRDSLTGEARLLLGGAGDQAGAILSPDGQLIAYDDYAGTAGRASGANPHEWVANIDGSNPRQILEEPFTFNAFAWAPDSRSVLIGTSPRGAPQLWIAPADGSGARRVTLESIRVWDGTWDPITPGGLLVRGEADATHLADLYLVDAKGTIVTALGLKGANINGPQFEFSGMTFSPDGRTIAYNAIEAREQPVNRFRVHVVNRDGTGDRAIPAPLPSGYSQAWPLVSPDGRWILMDTWESKADGTVAHQLAIAPTDGSAVARRIGPVVTSTDQVKTWSPDGSRILQCMCDRDELYSIDPVSGAFEKLPWSGDLPGWQRRAP